MNLQIRASIITTTMDVCFHLPFCKEMPCHCPPLFRASPSHATGSLGFVRNQYARSVTILPLPTNAKVAYMLVCSYLNSSSLSWDPKVKKKELFHSNSRFILVHPTDLTIPLLAFSMFRFDKEEDEVVLYW